MKMPSDIDIAAAMRRNHLEIKCKVAWSFLLSSAAFSLSFQGGSIAGAAVVGAVGATLELASAMWQQSSQDVPQNFLDELREKASEISAHRNAKGLWIVRDPAEENLRVMTSAEFKQYEKLVAAQGRGLDKLQVSENKLTYCRYVGGKLHAPENEPAMLTLDLKTGKGEGKFFTNGVKVFVKTEDMKLPFGAQTAPSRTGNIDIKTEKDFGSKNAWSNPHSAAKKDLFDFEDGNGPVPAHQHTNPDGGVGGWIRPPKRWLPQSALAR